MPARAEYKALKQLYVGDALGYNPGDDVYADVADSQGWVPGEDVEPSGLELMPEPAKNASRAAWEAYALDQGMDPAVLTDMGRDEIIAYYEDEQT
jgi:hypothetical protein